MRKNYDRVAVRGCKSDGRARTSGRRLACPKQSRLDCGQARRLPHTVGRCGFTLLEMTVVIVMLGILVSIAGPKFASSVNRHRADSSARRIAADLELVRNMARITSHIQTVTFDKNANTYTCTGLTDPEHPSKTYTARLSDTPYPAKLTTVTVGGDTTLNFDGYGSPDSSATITVTAGSSSRSVIVNSITGAVSVQ